MGLARHSDLQKILLHGFSVLVLVLAIARWIPIVLALLVVGLASGSADLSAFRRRRELARRRRSADALIAALPDGHLPYRLRWRIDELTDPAHRRELGRQLHMFARMARERLLITAIPVSLSTLRPNHGRLESLADLVERVEQPVAPRGIVLLEALLDDGDRSPLYGSARAEELGSALSDVADAMLAQPRRASQAAA